MFVDFAGHVSSDELIIAGAGHASTAEVRIHLKLTLNQQTVKRLGSDNGDDIREAEPVMAIRSGEPVYANGERIEGGCGALWYIPAFNGNPTFLEGLAYLPEREFERVWRMLSLPTVLRMMVNAQIGNLPFSAREGKWIWATAG